MFRKDAHRQKKLNNGFFHNQSENSSVAQDQKSSKRSPPRLGKHTSARKTFKIYIGKKRVSKIVFVIFQENLFYSKSHSAEKTESGQLCLQSAVIFCWKTRQDFHVCKEVCEKSYNHEKVLREDTLAFPYFSIRKIFLLNARLETTYPCF